MRKTSALVYFMDMNILQVFILYYYDIYFITFMLYHKEE